MAISLRATGVPIDRNLDDEEGVDRLTIPAACPPNAEKPPVLHLVPMGECITVRGVAMS